MAQPIVGTSSAPARPCVLVFAGVDPSGGAGVYADVQAIAATGAHALAVVTVLTVQDHNRVHAVYAVPTSQVQAQAEALMAAVPIAAVKIGIVGSRANAECIAGLLIRLKLINPDLPVVLDPVLASGHGDALTREDALAVIEPLLAHATLITPNLPEAAALCHSLPQDSRHDSHPSGLPNSQSAAALIARGAQHVLIKGGHGLGDSVVNAWFASDGRHRTWEWPRLPGEFHGSGCTLASAIAGQLARGVAIEQAIAQGQAYCQQTLEQAFAIGPGQQIPNRTRDCAHTWATEQKS
ncbi:MAG: hydroxymethylpyrimidine/phosphomethylpyrimidine kinase [Pseudomonadota bacterium]